jgi:hypothetical protein
MKRMTEQQVRDEITKMFLVTYLPKVKQELQRYSDEAGKRLEMGYRVSTIVGRPIGIELGTLHIAEPTNAIIDSLVKLYVQENERVGETEQV